MTVTVTHNRAEGRQDGWQREGGATRMMEDIATRGEGVRTGWGKAAANDRGWRRWWT